MSDVTHLISAHSFLSFLLFLFFPSFFLSIDSIFSSLCQIQVNSPSIQGRISWIVRSGKTENILYPETRERIERINLQRQESSSLLSLLEAPVCFVLTIQLHLFFLIYFLIYFQLHYKRRSMERIFPQKKDGSRLNRGLVRIYWS